MDFDFHLEVEAAIEAYEKANQFVAVRTREMISRWGEKEALAKLVCSADLQQGFQVLRDNGELDKTFEAIVLRHQEIFTPDAILSAKWRLENPYSLL